MSGGVDSSVSAYLLKRQVLKMTLDFEKIILIFPIIIFSFKINRDM